MAATAPSVDLLLRDIGPEHITPHFQPIVDLYTATVIGYEVLSRGPSPFQSPTLLFARARQLDLTTELEEACQIAAFDRIADLAQALPAVEWFVNMSPEVFCGLRTTDSVTISERARSHGIDPAQIVFEITEHDVILDHERFRQATRSYANEGFHIAIDDFGSGSSGLVTLAWCMPHVIKMDMELTRRVHAHPYKQSIVRSVVSLASSVDARLIAEGVETWLELERLVRQGVRFAQGHLFAEASPVPGQLPEGIADALRVLMNRCSPMRCTVDEAVSRLADPTFSVQRGAMTCGELESVFHAHPELDCAVVLEGRRPLGIITRGHIVARMGGRFGYALTEHKPIDSMMKPLTLSVADDASIVQLATLAMNRKRDDLYDPVVVTGNDGAYHGTVTMRQLIVRAAEIEIQQAREANPLTLLPGNRQISAWIDEAMLRSGTLLYADLDRFKELNDAFGFVVGDEAIRLTAQVLALHLPSIAPDARLGHLGGDDFVIVAPGGIDLDAVERLCVAFDQAKRSLFDEETLRTGEFYSSSRRGVRTSVPMTTLSIAVVSCRLLGRSTHPALLSQVTASVKRKAKDISSWRGVSSFMMELRAHHGKAR